MKTDAFLLRATVAILLFSMETATAFAVPATPFPPLPLQGDTIQQVTHPNAEEGDQFGISISSIESERIAVGAPTVDGSSPDSGAVFLFQRIGEAPPTWILIKTIHPTLSHQEPDFGRTVGLSNDTLAVQDTTGVTLYERNAGGPNSWGLRRRLSAPDARSTGKSLAITPELLLVGRDSTYLFEKDLGGPNAWGLRKIFTSPGLPFGLFGYSVAATHDTLLIAAPQEDDNQGRVYIYERDQGGQDNWGLRKVLIPPSIPGLETFGWHVDLQGDRAAVGHCCGTTTSVGFIYERDWGGPDNWGMVTDVVDPLATGGGLWSPQLEDDMLYGSYGSSGLGITIFRRNHGGPDNWGLAERRSIPGSQTPGWDIASSGGSLLVSDLAFQQQQGAVWALEAGTRLEAVDTNPLFLSNGQVITDHAQLSTGGIPRTGVVADGVSRLLLRYQLPGPGTVDFSLRPPASAPEDGGLDAVGGDQRLQDVSVQAVQTPSGWTAFALYRTPEEFEFDESLDRTRTLEIDALFSPQGGGQPVFHQLSLDLARPPLVFVHGLWSRGSTWTMPLASDSRFLVIERQSYPNALSFAENQHAVRLHVAQALHRIRAQGYAAAKVDVIGHSMGGILARMWTSSPGYESNESFGEGNVRKLFTLDTPHFGSEMGSLVSTLSNGPLGFLFRGIMESADRPVDLGALDDLARDSPAITALEASPTPAHALVGVGGNDFLSDAPGFLGIAYKAAAFFGAVVQGPVIFGGEQHDFLVAQDSQQGGLPPGAATLFAGIDGVHTVNTSSSLYSNWIHEYIRFPVSQGGFGFLPAPSTVPLSRARLRFGPTAGRIVQGELEIASPAPGSIVHPGQMVEVIVEPMGGALVENVLLSLEGTILTDDEAPFVFLVTVPTGAIGALTLSAVGRNASADFFSAPDVTVSVEQEAELVALQVVPANQILFGSGSEAQLEVLGEFDDGISRVVTSPSAGTTYSVEHPAIAQVSADGVVTALALGETSLLVENGGIAGSAWITVLPELPLTLFADGFESGDTSAWSTSEGGL